jgi:hypothetical protein
VSFPAPLQVFVEMTLCLALALFVLAAIPARTLPDPIFEIVGGRRELLTFSALCILCLGLFVCLVTLLLSS